MEARYSRLTQSPPAEASMAAVRSRIRRSWARDSVRWCCSDSRSLGKREPPNSVVEVRACEPRNHRRRERTGAGGHYARPGPRVTRLSGDFVLKRAQLGVSAHVKRRNGGDSKVVPVWLRGRPRIRASRSVSRRAKHHVRPADSDASRPPTAESTSQRRVVGAASSAPPCHPNGRRASTTRARSTSTTTAPEHAPTGAGQRMGRSTSAQVAPLEGGRTQHRRRPQRRPRSVPLLEPAPTMRA